MLNDDHRVTVTTLETSEVPSITSMTPTATGGTNYFLQAAVPDYGRCRSSDMNNVSTHHVKSHHVKSHHVKSHHVKSHHVKSHHVKSHHVKGAADDMGLRLGL
jgi:hypothetical protein